MYPTLKSERLKSLKCPVCVSCGRPCVLVRRAQCGLVKRCSLRVSVWWRRASGARCPAARGTLFVAEEGVPNDAPPRKSKCRTSTLFSYKPLYAAPPRCSVTNLSMPHLHAVQLQTSLSSPSPPLHLSSVAASRQYFTHSWMTTSLLCGAPACVARVRERPPQKAQARLPHGACTSLTGAALRILMPRMRWNC